MWTIQFPLGLDGSDGTEAACNAEDLGLIPGSGRSSGEGNEDPLQYSCLENSMDREVWQATVHGSRKELDMTEHASSYLNNDGHPSSE